MQAIGQLLIHPLNHPRNEGDLWIGVGSVWDPEANQAWKFKVAGFACDLSAKAEGVIETQFSSCEFIRLISVNASRSVGFVRRRTSELGLPKGDDYSDAFLTKRRGK